MTVQIQYSDITGEVLPYLNGNPSDPLVESAIKKAVIKLCNDSWIWKFISDPIDITAGESAYDIEIPQDTSIAIVMKVKLSDGSELSNKSTDWLETNVPLWNIEQNSPKYFTQIDLNQIILAPIPSANISSGLIVTSALKPGISSDSFPSWIAEKYLYDIVSGALSDLMAMPGKEWTEAGTALMHLDKFSKAIGNARVSAVNGLGRGIIRTTIPG